MTDKQPTNPLQHVPGEAPASPPTGRPPVRQTGPHTAPPDRDVADPHLSDEQDPYRERQGDAPATTDRSGVNPSGLGPAQPVPDSDHDQVPGAGDAETLTPSEHGALSDSIERQRDA